MHLMKVGRQVNCHMYCDDTRLISVCASCFVFACDTDGVDT